MKRPLILLAALGLWASPALAHHAFALFDREQEVTLRGAVRDYRFGDPHILVVLEAAGPDGTVRAWTIETLSASAMRRRGWGPETFRPGDRVTLVIHPARDGQPLGQFIGARLADGAALGRIEP